MYINHYIIGIDCHLAQVEGTTPREILNALGYNSGHIVFSAALHRCIVAARRGKYAFEKGNLHGHDSIVIAASNWLNPYEDLSALLENPDHSDLPIIMVGLGAQTPSRNEIPRLT